MAPATVRVIEADGCSQEHVYWDPPFGATADDAVRTTADWEELLHAGLRTAVERRMVADVPVGGLLSGGVDASLLVGLPPDRGQHGLSPFPIGLEAHPGQSWGESPA